MDATGPHKRRDKRTPLPGGETTPRRQQRRTVLVVDDEGPLRTLIQEILEVKGYMVLAAGEIAEALRICDEHAGRIDLLLTDVLMPEMNGRDLAIHMRAVRPGLKVLYMSGYAEGEGPDLGEPDPESEFLPKPFTPVSLERKVRETLGEH